jgi:large subunit ribosomal protein L2
LYRIIDFKGYDKRDIPAKVATIEYDPYRTCRIALLNYKDGEKRYHISPQGIAVGDKVLLADKTKLKPGNRMLIRNFPVGFTVYNIELNIGKGGQMIRSAGSSSKIMSQEDPKYTQIQLPSGEVRLINKKCYASYGIVSNADHSKIVIGKAGRTS